MLRIILLTSIAMLAFAGNSVLSRLALASGSIDAASFSSIRLVSGIVMLAILLPLVAKVKAGEKGHLQQMFRGSYKAAAYLFIYVIGFSYAYLILDTGVGALILFGSVQLTMILISLFTGARFRQLEWIGLLLAIVGFVYLVWPSLTEPSLVGFVLMTVAGIAWGLYTLKGRGADQPVRDTAYNFIKTLPMVAVLTLLTLADARFDLQGVLLAMASGALASGLGYAIWYMALPGLQNVQAAVVQLTVPVIAAAGGVVFAGELIDQRLIVASLLVLGGVLCVFLSRHQAAKTA
ncbi:DMT family transporter [Aliamphritea spongicola]|uniref:DMT family transporter n=1 Tax=Aliamphritea spongicola TaxID=707589 RepID=UPI00301402D2